MKECSELQFHLKRQNYRIHSSVPRPRIQFVLLRGSQWSRKDFNYNKWENEMWASLRRPTECFCSDGGMGMLRWKRRCLAWFRYCHYGRKTRLSRCLRFIFNGYISVFIYDDPIALDRHRDVMARSKQKPTQKHKVGCTHMTGVAFDDAFEFLVQIWIDEMSTSAVLMIMTKVTLT